MLQSKTNDSSIELTITCDKCKYQHKAWGVDRNEAGKSLHEDGWRMNPRARKYTHLCGHCLSKGKEK